MTHRTEPPHIPTLEEVDTAAFRRTSIEHWHNNDVTIQRTSLDRLLVEVLLKPGTALIRYSWKAEPSGYTYQVPPGPPWGSWGQWEVEVVDEAVRRPKCRAEAAL